MDLQSDFKCSVRQILFHISFSRLVFTVVVQILILCRQFDWETSDIPPLLLDNDRNIFPWSF